MVTTSLTHLANPKGCKESSRWSKSAETTGKVISHDRTLKGCKKVAGGRSPRRPPEVRGNESHPEGVPDLRGVKYLVMKLKMLGNADSRSRTPSGVRVL